MSQWQLRPYLADVPHILLDFDGPVCDVFAGLPASEIAASLLALYEERAGAPFPLPLSSAEDPLEIVRQAGVAGDTFATLLGSALSDAELRAVESAVPTPGSLDAIAGCLHAGKTVSIVSNNNSRAIGRFLELHGLGGSVSPVIGRPRDVGLMKPHPYSLHRALDELKAAARAVLVGDSASDMEAARAAGPGVGAIGYANRPGKFALLEDAGADIVIGSMEALAEAVR
ncbi:HAD family hydrolase [Streptomyces sp. NPDC048685]|uniref:HAD family hydrolase n=1 Tax=Streptomyces sp. NPDC048685 TaxID=3365584 RepID=UPI00372052A9